MERSQRLSHHRRERKFRDRQVFEADEVRVVAAMLTGRLQSCVSDIDAASVWPLGCKDHSPRRRRTT
jgi:hypothetical protein